MTKKVCCKETAVAATKNMNERDYLVDILSSEKDITKNMCVALTEASNEKLHSELKEIFDTVECLQREAYNLAWNKGWYTLEEAEATKISKKQTELQTKFDELSN